MELRIKEQQLSGLLSGKHLFSQLLKFVCLWFFISRVTELKTGSLFSLAPNADRKSKHGVAVSAPKLLVSAALLLIAPP